MDSKPITSITITDETIDQMLVYTRYFIQEQQHRLNDYLKELERFRDHFPESHEDSALATMQSQIAQAEVLLRELEASKGTLVRIYKWNFVKLADVMRKVRLFLGQDTIESMYSLKIVVEHLMEMLKSENSMFSRDKFIKYINEGGHPVPGCRMNEGTMQNPRNPTNEEVQQVIDYEEQHFGIYIDEKELRADTAMAVFDDYLMRGFQGRMLVKVNTDGLTAVYVWDYDGRRGVHRLHSE